MKTEAELKQQFKAIETELKRLEQILKHDDDTSDYWNNIDRVLSERAAIIAEANANNIQLFE
jgi:DNA repair exonuclease SbcCD ATPase subunit